MFRLGGVLVEGVSPGRPIRGRHLARKQDGASGFYSAMM